LRASTPERTDVPTRWQRLMREREEIGMRRGMRDEG
jgi:hypothetical protein